MGTTQQPFVYVWSDEDARRTQAAMAIYNQELPKAGSPAEAWKAALRPGREPRVQYLITPYGVAIPQIFWRDGDPSQIVVPGHSWTQNAASVRQNYIWENERKYFDRFDFGERFAWERIPADLVSDNDNIQQLCAKLHESNPARYLAAFYVFNNKNRKENARILFDYWGNSAFRHAYLRNNNHKNNPKDGFHWGRDYEKHPYKLSSKTLGPAGTHALAYVPILRPPKQKVAASSGTQTVAKTGGDAAIALDVSKLTASIDSAQLLSARIVDQDRARSRFAGRADAAQRITSTYTPWPAQAAGHVTLVANLKSLAERASQIAQDPSINFGVSTPRHRSPAGVSSDPQEHIAYLQSEGIIVQCHADPEKQRTAIQQGYEDLRARDATRTTVETAETTLTSLKDQLQLECDKIEGVLFHGEYALTWDAWASENAGNPDHPVAARTFHLVEQALHTLAEFGSLAQRNLLHERLAIVITGPPAVSFATADVAGILLWRFGVPNIPTLFGNFHGPRSLWVAATAVHQRRALERMATGGLSTAEMAAAETAFIKTLSGRATAEAVKEFKKVLDAATTDHTAKNWNAAKAKYADTYASGSNVNMWLKSGVALAQVWILYTTVKELLEARNKPQPVTLRIIHWGRAGALTFQTATIAGEAVEEVTRSFFRWLDDSNNPPFTSQNRILKGMKGKAKLVGGALNVASCILSLHEAWHEDDPYLATAHLVSGTASGIYGIYALLYIPTPMTEVVALSLILLGNIGVTALSPDATHTKPANQLALGLVESLVTSAAWRSGASPADIKLAATVQEQLRTGPALALWHHEYQAGAATYHPPGSKHANGWAKRLFDAERSLYGAGLTRAQVAQLMGVYMEPDADTPVASDLVTSGQPG